MFIINRSQENPLLSPRREHPWEAAAAFNWCPIKDGRYTHVVYRALSEKQLLEEPHINRSIIGRATTKDGTTYTNRVPFIVPEHEYEKYGCEDPRVTYIDGTYYTFYTALGNFPFSAEGIKVAVALSTDMETVQEKHLVTPFNAKAMVLFPEKIRGQYAALLTMHTDLPGTNIALALFDHIEDMWSESYWKDWYANKESHIIDLHRGNDDQVEVGAVPIKTKDGWLAIYSHATEYYSNERHSFGIEAVLLDLKDPKMIIGRTKGAFMVSEEYYEQVGIVPGVVFPSGALMRGEYLDIYYGASDTHCCIASVRLQDLIKSILPTTPPLITRFSGNPIITARPNKDWEAHGTLNPAAVEYGGKIHLFYRAMGSDDTSTFGYAATEDGFMITERSANPVYVPRADFESRTQPGNTGCEDARISFIDGQFIMTYVAYDGHTPRVAISTISEKDFAAKNWKKWSLPVTVTPPNVPDKDACIVPLKTKDGYVFIHRIDRSVCADILPTLNFNEQKINRCIEIITPRRGMWDGRKVGAATPPIKTKYGWILLYHGISNTGTYRLGAVLLDLKNPTIVLSRTATPIMEPQEDYELHGVVSKVVFPCGVVQRKNKLYIYYGGADNVVGVATVNLTDLTNILI